MTAGNVARDLSFFWILPIKKGFDQFVDNFFGQGCIIFHCFSASNLLLLISELKKFEGISSFHLSAQYS